MVAVVSVVAVVIISVVVIVVVLVTSVVSGGSRWPCRRGRHFGSVGRRRVRVKRKVETNIVCLWLMTKHFPPAKVELR
jgi:hypothetical protein